MRSFSLIAIALSSFAACTDAPPNEGDVSQSVVVNNRLSSNRLSSNRLSSNRLSSNRLSSNRLSSNHLQADLAGVGELLQTAEGQELLSYIVSCALPEGQVLVAPNPAHATNPAEPENLEFFGEVGLAARWIDRPLDKVGKRWVSACLYARVNANNVTVPISLRGPHAGLATDAAEVANWPLEEGAFYGDYFRPVNEPIIWVACRGKDQAAGETGGLADRDCAEPDPAHPGLTYCGFTYAGDCGDYAPPKSPHACGHFSSNGYWVSCKTTDAFPRSHHDHFSNADDDGDHDHDDDDDDHDGHDGHGHGKKVFHQVITTFTHG
ncbi:MAG: hypothetical protein IPQ07_08140 [Myxococcales bacterium]|nr:hypothetical protein [Myxococcales bacterium]